MAEIETKLDSTLSGLILMTIFTTVWAILAEYYFNNSDFRIIGIVFGIVIVYFIYYCLTFTKKKTSLPKSKKVKDPKKDKLFWIIIAIEGFAIFVAKNVLINIGKDQLFISCLALIVGLHFIPLAKVFDRKFDYYIGAWTTLSAIVGFVLILQQYYNYNIVNAFLCVSCAISTTLYGLRMINNGKKILAA